MRWAMVTSSMRVPGTGAADAGPASAVGLLGEPRRMPVTGGRIGLQRRRADRCAGGGAGRGLLVVLVLRETAFGLDGHLALPRDSLGALPAPAPDRVQFPGRGHGARRGRDH